MPDQQVYNALLTILDGPGIELCENTILLLVNVAATNEVL